MRRIAFTPLVVVCLGWWLLALGCGTPEPEPPPSPPRIESAGLGIALALLPAPFEVELNAGTDLHLLAPGPAGVGRLIFELGPEETAGINLVAEAESRKQWFESQPEGGYFGNLELVAPIGSIFTARGSYRSESGDLIEELQVFALHPAANRLLHLTYRYPPGEGRQRMQHLADLLGEIEALPAPG